ncbi:MAG: nucleoside-diphosphate sugar epimerase/dehydratase, partial [Omnitrophica WOR_2 bacterium]
VVGIVEDDDPTKHGMRVDGCWVIGGIKDIPNLIKKHDVGIIMVAVPGIAQEIKDYIQSLARDSNIRLVYLYELLEVIYQQLAQPA